MANNSEYNKVVSFRLDLRNPTQEAIYTMLMEWKREDQSLKPRMIAVLRPYATGEEAVQSTRLEDRIMSMLRDFLDRLGSVNPQAATQLREKVENGEDFDADFKSAMEDLLDQSQG